MGILYRVGIATQNSVKVRATKNAFRRVFGDVEIVVVPWKGGKQPFDHEIQSGAMERAKHAYEKTHPDFGVGIEAGLCRMCLGYIDLQVAAIYDGSTFTVGSGPGFQHPGDVIMKVMKGKSVGEAMEEFSGIKEIGRKGGAIGYLSKGIIKREEITETAVLMALVPRIHKGF
jgi:inosine/xanthosine triphosphatase